ncbi:MAG: hypothetical protein CMH52_14315 [Myxococcales bacterium]|nr:hypothetical protein [Myxococcales bacterium]
MLIEFKTIRRNDEIIGITSNSPSYPDIEHDLPPYTRDKVSVSVSVLPEPVAGDYYRSQVRQMNV